MKPMRLCRENPDIYKLEYPVWVFPKLDGIRCCIVDGKAKSSTLKDIPNKFIQEHLGKPMFNGLDGELILGPSMAKNVYRTTNSFVMSHDKVDDFDYFVFDRWDKEARFSERYLSLDTLRLPFYINVLHGVLLDTPEEVLAYEEARLAEGYEGIIIRMPYGKYKFGRTTMSDPNTYKLKRFEDSEAVIVGFEEEMRNGNEAQINELGRTKRQTLKANMYGKGTLGALIVQDINTKVEFAIGSGFDEQDRKSLWIEKDNLIGRIVKYKFFPIGIKDKPRHPIFLGFRDKMDM
jgi:DNA ligase-1